MNTGSVHSVAALTSIIAMILISPAEEYLGKKT